MPALFSELSGPPIANPSIERQEVSPDGHMVAVRNLAWIRGMAGVAEVAAILSAHSFVVLCVMLFSKLSVIPFPHLGSLLVVLSSSTSVKSSASQYVGKGRMWPCSF